MGQDPKAITMQLVMEAERKVYALEEKLKQAQDDLVVAINNVIMTKNPSNEEYQSLRAMVDEKRTTRENVRIEVTQAEYELMAAYRQHIR